MLVSAHAPPSDQPQWLDAGAWSVFTLAPDAVITRQAGVEPTAWPVLGPTHISGPPMAAPHDPPLWWSDALITE